MIIVMMVVLVIVLMILILILFLSGTSQARRPLADMMLSLK